MPGTQVAFKKENLFFFSFSFKRNQSSGFFYMVLQFSLGGLSFIYFGK